MGDELLIHIAAKLRQCIGDDDILARLGGDEFALLLPDTSSRLEVTVAGHKVIETLNEPLRSHGGLTEQEVPFIVNRVIALPKGLRNFDAFLYATMAGAQ